MKKLEIKIENEEKWLTKKFIEEVLEIKMDSYFSDNQETEAKFWIDKTCSIPILCISRIQSEEIDMPNLVSYCKDFAKENGLLIHSCPSLATIKTFNQEVVYTDYGLYDSEEEAIFIATNYIIEKMKDYTDMIKKGKGKRCL